MSALVALLALAFGRLLDRAWLGDPAGADTAPGLLPRLAAHAERAGRGLMLGLGGLGALSMLADVARLGVARWSVGLLVVLAAGLSVWRLRGAAGAASTSGAGQARAAEADAAERPSEGASGAPSSRLRAACLGMWLLALAALALQLRSGWIRPTYQFDALTRWMFKAKVLHVDGTLFGALSYDEAFGFTHQRYPPLIAHIGNLPALIGGSFDDYQASALFVWFAVALVCLCGGTIARQRGALAGALAAVWIAHLPLVAFISTPPPGSGSWSAMADLPLALFVAGVGLALYALVRGARGPRALELGLLLGFAALTKNEGLPLVGGVALALMLAAPRPRWRVTLLCCGIALLLFVLLWGHAIPGIPALDEDYHGQLSAARLAAKADRLELILWGTKVENFDAFKGLLPEFVNFRNWNLTWPLVLVLLVAAGRAALRAPLRALWVVLLAQLAAYVVAYMLTAWSSPNAEVIMGPGGDTLGFLLNLTLGRLLLHVAPLAICAGLLAAPSTESRSG